MSFIALGELRFGAEKSQTRTKALATIERLTSVIRVTELPDTAAEHYGRIRAELQRKGQPIGNNYP